MAFHSHYIAAKMLNTMNSLYFFSSKVSFHSLMYPGIYQKFTVLVNFLTNLLFSSFFVTFGMLASFSSISPFQFPSKSGIHSTHIQRPFQNEPIKKYKKDYVIVREKSGSFLQFIFKPNILVLFVSWHFLMFLTLLILLNEDMVKLKKY